jgi:hypothetical protein
MIYVLLAGTGNVRLLMGLFDVGLLQAMQTIKPVICCCVHTAQMILAA